MHHQIPIFLKAKADFGTQLPVNLFLLIKGSRVRVPPGSPNLEQNKVLPFPTRGTDPNTSTVKCAHCERCVSSGIQRHTHPNTIAVGLRAHGFLGRWPAGNLPLVCGGNRYVTGSEIRAGCVSVHRCKWRQGSTAEKIPNGRWGAENPHTGIYVSSGGAR
jgi:hypothetical protein